MVVPLPRRVSATEQYLSADSSQAFLAFSGSISPFSSKTMCIFSQSEGSLPANRSPSIFIEKLSTFCRCFFNMDTMSIPLQPPSPQTSADAATSVATFVNFMLSPFVGVLPPTAPMRAVDLDERATAPRRPLARATLHPGRREESDDLGRTSVASRRPATREAPAAPALGSCR